VRRWPSIAIVLLGCGPQVETTSTAGDTSSSSTPSTASTADDHSTSLASTDASSPSSSSGDTSSSADIEPSSFLAPLDLADENAQCDIWGQDCPPGEKCMPWANDGGYAWNATRCTAVADDPKAPGEPCTVVESGVSGIDDCELGAMCWDVDPETNVGECVAMCRGSEQNPSCADPCTRCQRWNDGVVIVCLPDCDPFAQDCGETGICHPVGAGFGCTPWMSSRLDPGEPCFFSHDCGAGSYCAEVEDVPGCEGDDGCCTPFCDVDAPDECDAITPGTACVPWFDTGRGAPDSCGPATLVGACILPR
jgi:hypothetical protein